MWIQFCLAFLILNGVLKPTKARLYRLASFPIEDAATTTYYQQENRISKVQCAEQCDRESVKCKSFNFFPNNNTCQFANFNLANPSVASSAQKISGYVENGWY